MQLRDQCHGSGAIAPLGQGYGITAQPIGNVRPPPHDPRQPHFPRAHPGRIHRDDNRLGGGLHPEGLADQPRANLHLLQSRPARHTVGKVSMQKIERKHLTLRTRLKRLARKTLCFSRSRVMHDLLIGLYMNRVEFGRPV